MVRRILLGLAIILLAVVAAGLAFFSQSERLPTVAADPLDLSGHPELRRWEEHDAIYQATEFPFVVEVPGAVLYVGVRHSSDPGDPQFAVLNDRWEVFAPTVALNEGRARYIPVLSGLFGGFSDPLFVYEKARSEGIPIHTLEPSYAEEVRALLEEWPAEWVVAFFSLRVIMAESGGDASKAESKAPGLIAKRTDVEGLRGVISTAADLDHVWAEHVGDGSDWRTIANIDRVEAMKPIGDDSREVRGEHMVRAIATLVARGERVVAVVGASHVIRQEPMLLSVLGETDSDALE